MGPCCAVVPHRRHAQQETAAAVRCSALRLQRRQAAGVSWTVQRLGDSSSGCYSLLQTAVKERATDPLQRRHSTSAHSGAPGSGSLRQRQMAVEAAEVAAGAGHRLPEAAAARGAPAPTAMTTWTLTRPTPFAGECLPCYAPQREFAMPGRAFRVPTSALRQHILSLTILCPQDAS